VSFEQPLAFVRSQCLLRDRGCLYLKGAVLLGDYLRRPLELRMIEKSCFHPDPNRDAEAVKDKARLRFRTRR
jgi:hypothetical protein